MKRYLIIPALMLIAFTIEATQASLPDNTGAQYEECVAVSLFSIEGRELNSIVENKRMIEKANSIPEGWTVVGVTTKEGSGSSSPHLVICH